MGLKIIKGTPRDLQPRNVEYEANQDFPLIHQDLSNGIKETHFLSVVILMVTQCLLYTLRDAHRLFCTSRDAQRLLCKLRDAQNLLCALRDAQTRAYKGTNIPVDIAELLSSQQQK